MHSVPSSLCKRHAVHGASTPVPDQSTRARGPERRQLPPVPPTHWPRGLGRILMCLRGARASWCLVCGGVETVHAKCHFTVFLITERQRAHVAAFGGIEGIWDPAVPVLQMGRRGSERPSHLSRGAQLLSDRVKIPIQCIQKQNLFCFFFPPSREIEAQSQDHQNDVRNYLMETGFK